MGAPAAGAAPALLRRLYDRDHRVQAAAASALQGLGPFFPPPLRTWLLELTFPPGEPGQELQRALASGFVPDSVLRELARTCGRRARWYRRIAGVPEEATSDPLSAWSAARAAADEAARAALRRAKAQRRPEEVLAGARADEHAWQLACLCRLLCGALAP
jgi:hypothetical protein